MAGENGNIPCNTGSAEDEQAGSHHSHTWQQNPIVQRIHMQSADIVELASVPKRAALVSKRTLYCVDH